MGDERVSDLGEPYVVHGSFDERGKQIPGTCLCEICRPETASSQRVVRMFRDGKLIETLAGTIEEARETERARDFEWVPEAAQQIPEREYYVRRLESILGRPSPLPDGWSAQIFEELIEPLLGSSEE